MKEIDQIDLSTAQHIQKWLLPDMEANSDAQLKAGVRQYLRSNKLTPYEALEKIEKQNSSMPKHIF